MPQAVFLTGDKEVDRMLRTLEVKLQRKAFRVGTRAGAKIVLERAKRKVPVDTGTLEDTMTVRAAKGTGKRKFRRGLEFGHTVTHRDTGAEDPFYAHFVEFGTDKWKGKRYIRPALYDSEAEVKAEVIRAIKAALPAIARNRF